MKKIQKTVSVLLSVMMVLGLFAAVPLNAAAEGTSTVDENGRLTLHAGVFSDPDFGEAGYTHEITSVYAEPGVIIEGDCAGMFYGCENCTSIDLSNADMSDVTGVKGMFAGCYQCASITLPSQNVSLGSTTKEMFYGCRALHTIDLSGCDTSQVKTMYAMFKQSGVTTLDLSGFNTAKTAWMSEMFSDCASLTSVDVSQFNTASAVSMQKMFGGCKQLTELDLSSFDTAKVGDFGYMFYDCRALTTIYVGSKWNVDGANGASMFFNCQQIRGAQGTRYHSEMTGISRAHIDGGTSNPGYLTGLDKVTVLWTNYDGTVLRTQMLAAGSTPSYTGATPVKPDSGEYRYTFTGWLPEPGVVTEDTIYTAKFDEESRVYTVTWKNDNGDVIDTTQADYGTVPTHADPVKPNEGNTVYTFTGWNPTPSAITGDTEYTAVFTAAQLSDWGMLQSLIDQAPDGTETVITLTKSCTAEANDTALVIPSEKIITLDLGGFTLDRGLSGQNAVNGGNAITNNGTLTLTGGTLTGGNNSAHGGAVVNNGTLTIADGSVTGNKSAKDGGAVYSNGTLNVTGGSIDANTAGESGGAVSTHSGTVNISGGAIRNNEAKRYHGGGIYVGNGATLNLTGGLITANRANNNSSQGGGILNNGVMNLSGDPVVSGNRGVYGKNVYLRPNHLINVTGTLSETASLGISIEGGNGGRITSGLNGNGTVNSFFSDADGFHIALNNGEAELCKNSGSKLFAGNTISLSGDIAVNFYIDPVPTGVTIADIQNGSKTLTVNFTWAADPAPSTDLSKFNVTINENNYTRYRDGTYFKVKCEVAVAEMTCAVKATASLNGFTAEKAYSVRDYAATVLDPDSSFSAQYRSENGADKYGKLVDLVTKMLDYGAKAQTVFDIRTGDLASSIIPDYTMQNVTPDMFNTAIRNGNPDRPVADRMEDVAETIGAEYDSGSLVYLSKCTLRHYFTFNEHPEAFEAVKDSFKTDKAPYYYVEQTNISARKLDKMQVFTIGGDEYYTSALDLARELAQSSNATAESRRLAKALYWYNQAAIAFFDDQP